MSVTFSDREVKQIDRALENEIASLFRDRLIIHQHPYSPADTAVVEQAIEALETLREKTKR